MCSRTPYSNSLRNICWLTAAGAAVAYGVLSLAVGCLVMTNRQSSPENCPVPPAPILSEPPGRSLDNEVQEYDSRQRFWLDWRKYGIAQPGRYVHPQPVDSD